MPAKWQRIPIILDDEYKPAEREAIGLEVIDYIRQRTLSGKDKNDRAWAGKAAVYTEQYKKFKKSLGGKTSKVDIRLSGDTLAAMEVLSNAKGKIVIGFQKGTEENAKADGNIRGTYGRSVENDSKARDFLGITDRALKKILSNYPLDDRSETMDRTSLVQKLSAVGEKIRLRGK